MNREEHEAYWQSHLGEFIAIPLGEHFGFARCVKGGLFAFYNLLSPAIPPIEEIKPREVLFILCCSSDHLMRKIWTVVGQEPLEGELALPPVFVRNPEGSDYIDVYRDGAFRPYAGEDLTKIDIMAVWDEPSHVEERLLNQLTGKPCRFARGARVRPELAERVYREYWAKHGGAPDPTRA
jgi:hypothetical protein